MYGKSDPANNPLTVAAWFKTSESTQDLTAVHGSGPYTSGDFVGLGLVGGRPEVALHEAGSAPSDNRLTHAKQLADDQWHHMVMTFAGGSDDTLRLFVDGKLSGVRTQSAGAMNIDDWSVGCEYDGAYYLNYFDGLMDDVRMYDRALSDGGVSTIGQTAGGDVAELYALGIPEPGTLLLLTHGALGLLLLSLARRLVR